jgi:hypothetical protein
MKVGFAVVYLCLAVPAAAADDPSAACAFAATMEFNKANIALLSTNPLMSVDAQIAHRRLEEGYCLKYAHCLVDNLKLAAADIALSGEFSACLREQAEAGR